MFAEVILVIKILSKNTRDTSITTRSKDIRHMNVEQKPSTLRNLKDIVTNIRSMDTKHMNAYPNLSGHQTNKQRYIIMKITSNTRQ